ncbi:MAG: DUF4340 domain-containing protein [Phycisphaerae bacterium]|nr:DUF4340 domain-containing protein [Phycisphaerae bacterium]NIP56007.1 DUF4340 domain-containing protein [Phycisphaerae bacterium]NIS54571.1 DUF4340 domain-containing protein [Phycisphaerae bacterium]NIU10554.1 DUF4340 domain-containing protein [Phycisphaerae bacterium]NIU60015.1 DUF4340 domain-containing protein [Phycisphaerae bacterium]
MSNKNLTILGIVTILMVIWAVVQSRVSSMPRSGPEALSYLIPGLDTTGIGSIVVGTGEDSVTLKRRGRDFVVTNKDNYPAVTSTISELITTCLDIKTAELYTDESTYHEDLEVTEEKARSVVKFMTPEPNSAVLAGVVVGKSRELGEGTYVRLISDDKVASDKVYVTSNVPFIKSQATDYIEQELVSVNRDDINSVTVSYPGGDYTLKPKEGSKDITLVNIQAGKKAKSSECDSVFGALSNLRFDDVRAQSTGLLFDRRYVCKLNDSTVYTLEIAKKDDKTYVSCTAEYTGEVPKKDMTKVEPEEVLKEKEAKLLAWEKAQKFAAKHKGWKYEIADWKAKDLTKELSELVEDEEKPEEVKGPEEPNSVSEIQPVEPNSV